MLIIDDTLISDDVIAEEFACNLRACRGACCHEGDYGAPLEPAERTALEQLYPLIAPFLTERGRRAIAEEGLYTYVAEEDTWATPCVGPGGAGACAYMVRTPEGFAACGMEVAYRAGATDFKKPVSCELYPVRVEADAEAGFEALNYDRWDICSAACAHGAAHRVPVFRFVRAAIERKWGEGFYEQLEAYYRQRVAHSAEADPGAADADPRPEA